MIYYLVGIKGAAMSSLAKILKDEGHIVRGVDYDEEYYTINSNDFEIENFNNMSLKSSYFYIIGNAFVNHKVTKEIVENFYFKFFPDFLNYYFDKYKWICVAGTHGKTTSTKMLSTVLTNSMTLIGNGEYQIGKDNFILESCEYKDTFLKYKPYISLVLNVDYDHVDYFSNKREYDNSFIKFINNSKICVLNGDDFFYNGENIIKYGRNNDNDVVFTYENGKVTILNKIFFMPVKGLKFAYNFVGVYLVSKLLNLQDYQIQKKINSFQMPKRRYQKTLINNQVVILDYAHHPSEIDALLQMVKEEYVDQTIVCIFEPHTLSRLDRFKEEFKNILDKFDRSYLLETYCSVREEQDVYKMKELYDFMKLEIYSSDVELRKYDVVLFLGAGKIDSNYRSYVKNRKIR